MSRQYTRQTILWPICAAWIGLAAGCTASGYPLFAKFSPDARRLVYQDARYDHAYMYDLDTRQRYEIPGHVACMDRDVTRLVLLPRGYQGSLECEEGPISCSIVTLGNGRPAVKQLPALRVSPKCPVLLMEFTPDEKSLLATVYQTRYASGPESCQSLPLDDGNWVSVEIPSDRRDKRYYQLFSPGGVRQGSHFYHPVYEPSVVSEKEQLGMDVQIEFRNERLTYVLPSPDENYLLRIMDGEDFWHRLTLVHVPTMEKTVILDKNDAVSDVMDVCGRIMLIPLSPFLPRI